MQIFMDSSIRRERHRVPAAMQVSKDVVQAMEVRPQVGRLAPALAHDADGVRRRRAHGHGGPDQRRRPGHLLHDLCKQWQQGQRGVGGAWRGTGRPLPSGVRASMQYGSPRTMTSCMMMANANTSPGWEPRPAPLLSRRSSGAVQRRSGL